MNNYSIVQKAFDINMSAILLAIMKDVFLLF